MKFSDVKILNIGDDEYFRGDLKNHLSNSRLSLINESEGGSEAVFVSPKPNDDEYRAFKIGTAVHNLFLQGDVFVLSDFELPTNSVATIFNTIHKLTHRQEGPLDFEEALQMSIKLHNYYNGDPGEKRLTTLLENGMPYYNYLKGEVKLNEILLTTKDKELVLAVLSILKHNKEIVSLLKPDTLFDKVSFNEQAFICKIMNDGKMYNFKIKIDNWTYDTLNKEVILNDLKTTSYNIDNFLGQPHVLKPTYEFEFNLSYHFNPGSFQKYHYYRQFALYKQVLMAYLKQENMIDDTWTFKQNVIVVQTTYEAKCKVYSIDEFWIEKGIEEAQYLFDKLSSIDKLVFLDSDYVFNDL